MTNYAWSKRRPYPYDACINGQGLMLIENPDTGELVGKRSQPLTAQPTDYEYGSSSPFLEIPYPFRHLVMGMGEMVQPKGAPRRYKYAINVDASIDGIWQLGPKFHVETVVAGQPIRQIIRALKGGTESVFALANRYVAVRLADNSWSVGGADGGHDLESTVGVGAVSNQAERFKHAGGGAQDRLYVTSNNGNVLEYDGTNWIQYSGAQGPTSHRAQWVRKVGDELWFAWDNVIEKVESDPRVTLNYAGPITMGDASANITFLAQNKNILHVFKENGIFTVSQAALDQDIFPGLHYSKNTENGRNTAVWLDHLWVPFGDAFFRLSVDGTIQPIGTELMLGNRTPVRGKIVASAGHNTWFNYEALYDDRTNTSFLMKYGSWVETDDNRFNDQVVFSNVHHGALKQWTNKRVTMLQVVQFPGDNDRLYAGFQDGTVEWCYLPKNGPNPANDTNTEYTDQVGYIYWPDHHAGFQADPKVWRGFSGFGPRMTNRQYVTVDYRIDPSSSWTPLKVGPEDADDPARFTASGQRIDFPSETVPTGKVIEVRSGLHSDNDGVPEDDSPLLEGMAIHEAVRPSFKQEFTFIVDASRNITKRNGQVSRTPPTFLRQIIQSAVAAIGNVPVVMPDGTEEEMAFIDYTEMQIAPMKRNGLAWALVAKAVQYQTSTQPQGGDTLTGYSYGTLEQYTYGELEQLLS